MNDDAKIKLFLSGARSIYSKNGTYSNFGIKSANIDLVSGLISFIVQNVNSNTLLSLEFNFLIFSSSSFKYEIE